jgi:hypothetical protein
MTQLSLITSGGSAAGDTPEPRTRRRTKKATPKRSGGVPPRLRLDEQTRAIGLAHVAEARQRLAEMSARPTRHSAA